LHALLAPLRLRLHLFQVLRNMTAACNRHSALQCSALAVFSERSRSVPPTGVPSWSRLISGAKLEGHRSSFLAQLDDPLPAQDSAAFPSHTPGLRSLHSLLPNPSPLRPVACIHLR